MSTGLLTGTQKAALILIQLGKEQAAKVLSRLDDAEIEELTTEIARLERVDSATADEVLDEFYAASLGVTGFTGRGGLGFAQQLLQATVGHYGVFNGKRWERQIYPRLRDFIHAFDE